MIESIVNLLESIFKLGVLKEDRKYIDAVLKIKKDLWDEENKPLQDRNDAVITDLHYKLRITCDAVATDLAKQAPQNRP